MLRLKLLTSLFILIFFESHLLRAQTTSVLSQGDWYQLAVTQTGIFQLSGSFLQDQGIDIASLDPDKLGIFGFGGGMLAQPLSEPRYSDLPENHILITGTADGRLDPEDQIIFFAQGPDRHSYSQNEIEDYQFNYQKNLYADTAYYYLSLSEGNNLRISSQPSLEVTGSPIVSFDDFWVHESDEYNILEPGSGREWYGENFYNGEQLLLSAATEGISANGQLKISVDALGRTTSPSSMDVQLNQQSLGELQLTPILGGTYTDKGKEASALYEVSTDGLANSDELEIALRYQASDGRGRAHLNRIMLEFPRDLKLYGTQTDFRSLKSVEQSATRFVVGSELQRAQIWDVTNPTKPVLQQAENIDGTWQFVAETLGDLREFVIYDPESLPEPGWLGSLENYQPINSVVPELLIVTPASLRAAAENMAALRREHDQLEVVVATTESIYHHYASGRQDVSAIRNYAKDLYDAATGKFKYLLLFGKASYDYKGNIENNINLVPTYQSRNSLHPIYSFPSDDYYAFMEDDEGDWEETFRGDHTLDIGVGRLPVKNIQEAEEVVNKLSHYARNNSSRGDWRTRVTFLADDGDNDRYQKDSELLSGNLREQISGVNTSKIYLDAFEQEQFPNQELAPSVNEAIEEAIERGSLLFNFVGHGNEQRLTDENVFNVGMISNWQNLDRLPFFVTATCEFGRHDDPNRISGAERLVLNPEGGAVGMVTTARPVFSNTNYLLNQSFYKYVFARQNGDFFRLGEIFRRTKNGALNGRDNRNFTLLGDPSMRLAYPEHRILIDSILTADGQQADTLSAFQQLRIFGSISEMDQDTPLETFDGELTLVLHDKAKLIQTRGNEGTQMQFQQTNNVINRVRARVKSGTFSVDLLVPQNINYQTEQGRVSMYALSDQALKTDAFGGLDSLYIGGSLAELSKDQSAPLIRLFINDTTFRNGGLSNDSPRLIALLEDQQGINLSLQQPGHEILAELRSAGDGQLLRSFVLNDFYEPALDSYQQGRIEYPLANLEEGKYMLTLQAWDTHNNRSEASVTFTISNSGKLQVQKFINFPNPFNQSTTFVLEHNRAGEDLAVNLQIFDVFGKQLLSFENVYESAAGRLEFLDWNTENQLTSELAPGIYLARLSLRSLTDQQEVFQDLKIILTN